MRVLLITAEKECDKCHHAREVLQRLVARFPEVETQVLRYDDPQATRYGVVMSPTVVVDDVIVTSGRAPNERKLLAYVEQVLAGA